MVDISIHSSQLSEEVDQILRLYSSKLRSGIEQEVDKTMKQLVKNTKRDAPVLSGSYKQSISSRKIKSSTGEYAKQWYVKAPNHRLAHLLNNGHALRGGGRVKGDNHITNNEKIAVKEFEQAIKGVITKSGY